MPKVPHWKAKNFIKVLSESSDSSPLTYQFSALSLESKIEKKALGVLQTMQSPLFDPRERLQALH